MLAPLCVACANSFKLKRHAVSFGGARGFQTGSGSSALQDAYEERLDASLQCGHDNMHLRAELAAAAAAKAGAVKAAGREAAAEIAASRMQLQRRCAAGAQCGHATSHARLCLKKTTSTCGPLHPAQPELLQACQACHLLHGWVKPKGLTYHVSS